METVEFDSVKGKKIRVLEHVARLGFGTVRTAEYDGIPCQVKWFSKEELAKMNCAKQMYSNLTAHLEEHSPGKPFLWPIDVSKSEEDSFCYVLDNDLSAYRPLADFMEEKANYENWSTIANAALCLILSFSQLEKKQYQMMHLTEDDVFIHPKTGRVFLANMEFAKSNVKPSSSKSGKNNYIWKTGVVSRLLSPAQIEGKKAAQAGINDHMLAVLLFEILYLHHPLEGYRAASYPVMDNRAKKTVYGTHPCFVYDGEDDSNRPVRGIHINMIRRWDLYPAYIQEAFVRGFRGEVLKGTVPGFSPADWYKVFLKFRNCIMPCASCGTENIWQPGEQKCRKCKKPLVEPSLCYYKELPSESPDSLAEEENYPVFPGAAIYHIQLKTEMEPAQNDFYMPVAGKFIRTKANSSICLLQNVTDEEWTVTDSQGTERPLVPQDTIMLAEGMKIRAGESTIVIRKYT